MKSNIVKKAFSLIIATSFAVVSLGGIKADTYAADTHIGITLKGQDVTDGSKAILDVGEKVKFKSDTSGVTYFLTKSVKAKGIIAVSKKGTLKALKPGNASVKVRLGTDVAYTVKIGVKCDHDYADITGATKFDDLENITKELTKESPLVSDYVAPTCDKEGSVALICKKCGKSKTITLEALGHDYHVSKHTDSTCTKEGTNTYVCDRCHDTYTDTTPVIDCIYELYKTNKPSLTAYGYEEWRCSMCKKSDIRNKIWYNPKTAGTLYTTLKSLQSSGTTKNGAEWKDDAYTLWQGGSDNKNIENSARGALAFCYTVSDKLFGINPAKEGNVNSLKEGDIAFIGDDPCIIVNINKDEIEVVKIDGNLVTWGVLIDKSSITRVITRYN